MCQSVSTHMRVVSCRGLEASVVVGLALVLIVANFLSPSWPSSIRLSSAWRGRTSQLHAMATDYTPAVVVYVTVPNKETGSKLAHSIIENKLAACVNQIPGVESTYLWQGKVETDSELLLIIKTRQSLLQQLTDHVTANHPYDTPEVIAVPITGGSHKYLQWLAESTQKVLDA
jgi:periplasmic divalent cation tolerance protein